MDEGEQSWYAGPETVAALISMTRRVRCTLRVADRIIDRWMVRVGKGKRARPASPPCPLVPRSPFSLSPSSRPFITPLAVLLRSYLSQSPVEAPAFSLPPASVTCSSALHGFRYLIKSSYDEKDEDPGNGRTRRSSSISFYRPTRRPCSRERN